MFEEANFVPIQAKLVRDDKLTHRQKKASRTSQGRIFKAWDKYRNLDITAKQLLRRLSYVYEPNLPQEIDANAR